MGKALVANVVTGTISPIPCSDFMAEENDILTLQYSFMLPSLDEEIG